MVKWDMVEWDMVEWDMVVEHGAPTLFRKRLLRERLTAH